MCLSINDGNNRSKALASVLSQLKGEYFHGLHLLIQEFDDAAEFRRNLIGSLGGADCFLRSMLVCSEGYCGQALGSCVGDSCGTLQLAVARRQHRLLGTGGDPKPLQITTMSKPEIGKPLWLKFPLEIGADHGTAMLALDPDSFGGGYNTRVSVFCDGAVALPGKNAFRILSFDCERFAGTGSSVMHS